MRILKSDGAAGKGRLRSIVVVAEGAAPKERTISVASGKVDAFGHAQLGGIGQVVADALEERHRL